MRKLHKAACDDTGMYLTKNEVAVLSIDSGLYDAMGDYDDWEFDKNGQIIESSYGRR